MKDAGISGGRRDRFHHDPLERFRRSRFRPVCVRQERDTGAWDQVARVQANGKGKATIEQNVANADHVADGAMTVVIQNGAVMRPVTLPPRLPLMVWPRRRRRDLHDQRSERRARSSP